MTEAAQNAQGVSLIAALRSKGFTVRLGDGDTLRVGPESKLTLPVQEWIRKAQPLLIEELHAWTGVAQANECGAGAFEELELQVVELARHKLNPTGIEYDPHPVSPAPRGRDPIAQRTGDKVKFFRGDWREAEPRNFTVHRSDTGGAS